VAALAKQAGIEVTGEPVAGSDLEEMSDDELAAAAHNTTIFGRISPSMKEKLVRALQAAGHYVAMIGDGVNDVPAMKSAQVAVAVRSGSGITRSIADLVLLRDEFSRLPSAFREGQRVRMGMAGIFRLFLTRTLSLTLILILVSLLGDPFPVSPRHTGLIALMTVGIPTLGLAAWAQPGRTGRTIIAPSARFVVPAATTIAAVALVMFEFYWHTTEDLDQARTALTITCVLCGLLTIVFLEPPTPAWTGGSTLSGDWRPTIMAGVLAIVFFVTLASPALRDFYELKLPDVWGFMVIFLAVGAWAVALRAIWRFEAPPWLEESIARMRSPRKG
jgi:cation-transporting ATPase E